MDRLEYVKKMEEKLSDKATYKEMYLDPTLKIQTQLINELKDLKNKGEISELI